MPRLLQISQLGHPVLRKKAKSVSDVKDPSVQTLIDDLIATCMDADGVGIAAPQVYVANKIFILASHPNPRYPKAPRMKPTAVVNPKIIARSKKKTKAWEGCLSVPGIRASVPRSVWVDVAYTTRKGRRVKRRFRDFVARIFQHEYDHINGIIFLDRLESTKDIITEREYQRLISNNKK